MAAVRHRSLGETWPPTDEADIPLLVAEIEHARDKAARLKLHTAAFLLGMALLEICSAAYGERAQL